MSGDRVNTFFAFIFIFFYAKSAPKMRNFERGAFAPLKHFVLFFIRYQEQQHSKQQKENHFFC